MAYFEVLVPKFFNNGEPVSQGAFDALEEYLARKYEGYTRLDTSGAWISPLRGFKRDVSFTYRVYVKKVNRKMVEGIAKVVKKFWKQDNVMFVINGRNYFV